MIKGDLSLQELISHHAPSASRIIGGVTPNQFDFSTIPKNVLQNAIDRGNWVHKSIEDHINGIQYSDRWEWQGYMDAFHKFEEEHKIEYLASELPLVDNEERSKGVLDALVNLDGVTTILDFKTSASTNTTWEMQLMIYARMLIQKKLADEDLHLRVIKLGKDGTYKKLFYKYDPIIAQSTIDLYHYYVEKGLVKGK